MDILRFLLITALLFCTGCDRIYGLLHKPGGEERRILGEVVFNEYNPKVEELQKALSFLGYSIGTPDGKFGTSTREAVARFQEEEGLEVTRCVDAVTWERIQGYVTSPLVKDLKVDPAGLQAALSLAGFSPGRVDGRMGPRTKEAVRAFQRANGLSPDGIVGVKTLRVLLKATVPAAITP